MLVGPYVAVDFILFQWSVWLRLDEVVIPEVPEVPGVPKAPEVPEVQGVPELPELPV